MAMGPAESDVPKVEPIENGSGSSTDCRKVVVVFDTQNDGLERN